MSAKMVQLVYFLEFVNSLNSYNHNQMKQVQSTFIKLKDKSIILIRQIVNNFSNSILLNSGI